MSRRNRSNSSYQVFGTSDSPGAQTYGHALTYSTRTTRLSKEVLNRIQQNDPKLNTLNLSKYDLGFNLLELKDLLHALSDNTSLVQVDLSRNKMGDNCCEGLYYLLATNSSIKHLNLSRNLFSASCILRMASVLKPNITLTKLILLDENSSSIVNPLFRSAVKKVNDIISSNVDFHNNVLKEKSISIEKRKLTCIPSKIYESKSLTDICLQNNHITRIDRSLYYLKQLTSLDLSHNNIVTMDRIGLTMLENLTSLNLSSNYLQSAPFTLASLPLNTLDLSDNLFCSPFSFPTTSLQIKVKNYYTLQNILPSKVNVFAKIVFLSTSFTDCQSVVNCLKKNSLDAYEEIRTIPNSVKNVLENEIYKREKYFIKLVHWFPRLDEETGSKILPLRISRDNKRSLLRFSDNGIFSNSNRAESFSLPMHGTSPLLRQKLVKRSLSFGDVLCSQVHPSCIRIHECITGGYSNRAPIVIVYKLSPNIEEIILELVILISSIPFINEPDDVPLIIIVGNCTKSSEGIQNTYSTVQQRISQLYPWVNFNFVKVCTSFGKIKNLHNLILKHLQEDKDVTFPFIDSICNKDWLSSRKIQIRLCYDYFRQMKEEIRSMNNCLEKSCKSIITWDEFLNIIEKFDITPQFSKEIAIYLRHLGAIHYFDEEQFKKSSLHQYIFLLPDIIFRAFNDIKKQYNDLTVEISQRIYGVPCDSIPFIWKNIPQILHDGLLKVFESLGQLFLYNEFIIIPDTFPKPEFLSHRIVNQSIGISRCFSFEKMNDYDYCNLLKTLFHIIHSDDFPFLATIRKLNKYYIEIGSYSDEICTIRYDYLRGSVILSSLSKNYEDKSNLQLFCALSSNLEQYFIGNAKLKKSSPFIHALCICDNCKDTTPTTFSLDNIKKIIASGDAYIYCKHLPVRVDVIAPDLSFDDVEHLLIEYSSLSIIKEVGKGGFGTVYYGTFKSRNIAIKELDESTSLGETFVNCIKEVEFTRGLHHQNIVQLIGLCKKPYCIITEFCAYGDLYTYIQSRKLRNMPFPEDFILDLLIDICEGMEFLHSTAPPILHRDLKSANILLCGISPDELDKNKFCLADCNNMTPKPFLAKVSDFGLSSRTFGPVSNRVVDNPLWLAPELLSQQPYSCASDVYAFGMVIFEIVTLSLPYEEFNLKFGHEIENLVLSGTRPTIPDTIPIELKNIMTSCWQIDANLRPKFSSILSQLKQMHSKPY